MVASAYRRVGIARTSTGSGRNLGRYFFLRRLRAWTQFTPTMPAQEMATPTTLGSTSLAVIAVILTKPGKGRGS